jgi:hypothetical protein
MTRQAATLRPAISLEMDAESVRPFMRALLEGGRVKVSIESEHGSAFGAFDILSADKGGKARKPSVALTQICPMIPAVKRVTKRRPAASNPQAAPAATVKQSETEL